MRKVTYTVGRNGYTTLCNTLASVDSMLAQDPHFKVQTNLETIEDKKSELSPIRKAMLKQFGYVSPKLKDKVVL